jgi:hypothetical protein
MQLALQRNVGLPKLYFTRRLKSSKALLKTRARSHGGRELDEVFTIFHSQFKRRCVLFL